jgi:hypothetical protein
MKKYILFGFMLIATSLSAQNVFFETGMNFTSYAYADNDGNSNDNIEPGTGVYVRAGLGSIGYRSSFSYGISLNQFNATGGNGFDLYDWKVTHLGAFAQWNRYFNDDETFGFSAAFEFSTMVSGKQVLGESSYKLSEYDEFKGLWASPRFGLNYQVVSTNSVLLELGYNFQIGYKIVGSKTTTEKLSFNTHQFGVKLNIQ